MLQSDTVPASVRKASKEMSELIPKKAKYEHCQRNLHDVRGTSVEALFECAVRNSFEPVLDSYLEITSWVVDERFQAPVHSWMDENSSALLQKIVRTEIDRLLNARADRG